LITRTNTHGREFAKQIRNSDYICCVCTEGTNDSEGQAWEIENAFGQGKQRRAWVVATDRGYVPDVLAGYYHYIISIETVPEVVTEWLSRRRTGSGVPHVAVVNDDEAATSFTDRAPASLGRSEITDITE